MKRLLTLFALLVGLTTLAQLPSYVPTDGLVGYWGFNANYQLFDAQGRMVNEGVLTRINTTLNTTALATGNYVISIGNDQGVVRQQIIIER